MALLPRPRAFTIRATQSSPLTEPCFVSGTWFSQSVLQTETVAAHPRSYRSSGRNGASTLEWPQHTRWQTEFTNVYGHFHRTTKRLLPGNEPRRKANARGRFATDAAQSERARGALAV